jgi:hypothetical protein
MKFQSFVSLLLLAIAAPTFATVVVSSPSNGETVSPTVVYKATAAATTCSKGVASMGVYVDDKLLYVVDGITLNTSLAVSVGKHNTVVEEWDYCGGATYISMEITVSGQGGVYVTSPASGSTVSSPAHYVATATTSCPKGVASMGVYVNKQLMAVQNGTSLNTQINLGAGAQNTVVEEWDNCGGASYTPVSVTVPSVGGVGGKVISNIQASSGWKSWGQFAPDYVDCSANCTGLDWTTVQHVSSPSLSGNATQFHISGTTPYADVLWSNPLIGQFSTQNLPDTDYTLVPSIHNFTYDSYFYVSDAAVTQVLEFDINMYLDGVGILWGNQCDHLGGGDWDIWDNANGVWVSTGHPCSFVNGWNHVTIDAQRGTNNAVVYQSITLNGTTYTLNKSYAPFTVPVSWYGVTVNYQMDGNSKESANTTYVDNFSLTYW